MDSLILLSWVAYVLSAVLLLLASWKLMRWLPFTLKVGISLSQLAILAIPAAVSESAVAPVFIVLVLDMLTRVPSVIIIDKAWPLLVTLVVVWPLAFVLGWSRRHLQRKNKPTETSPENE